MLWGRSIWVDSGICDAYGNRRGLSDATMHAGNSLLMGYGSQIGGDNTYVRCSGSLNVEGIALAFIVRIVCDGGCVFCRGGEPNSLREGQQNIG